MSSQNLETRTGTLAQLVPQFEPGSILTSAQLMNERRTNPELREKGFYTADFALYRMEEGRPTLYIGSKNNPIFANFEEAQKSYKNYFPPEDDVKLAIKSASRFDMKKLHNMYREDYDMCSLKISTINYDKLNPERRRLAEAVYGEGNDFIDNMQLLRNKRISTTIIYLLPPDYVKIETLTREGEAIVRQSWLNDFYGSSCFNVTCRMIDTVAPCVGIIKPAE